MAKKIISFFIIFILFFFGLSLVSSFGFNSVEDSIGVFKQGENVKLFQTCSSCSYNNITTIKLGNGTLITFNSPMTKDGSFYNFTLSSAYTQSFGTYLVNGIGDENGTDPLWVYNFKINYYGKELLTSQAIVYGILIIIFLFIFVMIMIFIQKLPSANERDEEGKIMSISYLKYIRSVLAFVEWMLFIAILYITSSIAFAYLEEQLFAKTLFLFYRISFGVTPLIVTLWFIWIFVRVFQDKAFQKLINRGIFPRGNL